jgi:predicted AlkP superfamily phosphohydrolase/phosphomutase
MPAHGSRSARTLVIGIDGATFDQIIPLVKGGRLPHIGALLEQGSWGPLHSTIPPVTAPAWSSFMTGVNPGRHGIYDFRYRDAGTYELRTNNLTMNRAPTLWEVLSRHDKRSCLINIPASWPPRPINGFWVTGILTPADATTYTYPPELTEQIRRAIPDYEVWPASVFHPTGREREFLRTIEELTWKRVELFRFLQTRAEWDTAMVVFMGADQVQHAMWHYQDPTHPQYDPDAPAEFRDAIAHTYEVIDAAVGALLAEAGRELNVFLVSDHGFGPLDDWFHINTWLIQEGLMVLKPHVKSRLKHLLFSLGITPLNLYEWLLRLRLNRAVAHATRHRREETFALLRRLFVSFDDVDWSRTVAYSIGNAGPIFINLAGREPQGCVPPERYEETLEMVAERLRRITDPRTGRPLVTEIVFGKDVYAGPYASNGPDIMVLMRDMRVCAYGNTQFSSHRWLTPVYGRTGWHRMDGILVAAGPDIRQGEQVAGARLWDVYPTILALMDVPIPAGLDGQPLLSLLRDAARERIRYDSQGLEQYYQSEERLGYSAEEEEMMERHLKGLGYV